MKLSITIFVAQIGVKFFITKIRIQARNYAAVLTIIIALLVLKLTVSGFSIAPAMSTARVEEVIAGNEL